MQEERPTQEIRTTSFRLTEAFLRRHPRYRETLSLTPEHFRFDPVLWNSGLAALRELLRVTAEETELAPDEAELEEAVRNLVEGVMHRSAQWAPPPPEEPPDDAGAPD
jgi:hypothetical protein